MFSYCDAVPPAVLPLACNTVQISVRHNSVIMLVILSCCMIVVRVEQAVIRRQPVDTQILDTRVIVGAAVHINFQGQPNQTELNGLSERNDTPSSSGCSLCLDTATVRVGN
jgi:hypothetical protein